MNFKNGRFGHWAFWRKRYIITVLAKSWKIGHWFVVLVTKNYTSGNFGHLGSLLLRKQAEIDPRVSLEILGRNFKDPRVGTETGRKHVPKMVVA